MATVVDSNVRNKGLNDDGKHNAVADVTVALLNVLKFRRISRDKKSVSGAPLDRSSDASSDALMRRRSTLKGGLALNMRRLTGHKTEPSKPKFENTYKIGPETGEQISTSNIEQIAQRILSEEIADNVYDSEKAWKMACIISEKIKMATKGAKSPRYRIICQVVITEVKNQGLEAASRSLWNDSSDTFMTVTHSNGSICAITMIYAVYLE